ncbi:hypothetical protein [Actinomadura algeriensis]|uniref:DUF1963 domain-containing protein n=1 Tax=Actinomadura algeriensis TaxID=1679523 RepID=A0ABR9JUQ2_9ACTN|nr:hypothetical protein [Actinomadura algeriensis]MBE1534302.1 hypothetical protein [Actinomadura algeriensis]
MTRTTPPRPVDIAAVFPEIAPFARSATRLHPRPGTPGVHDSSVGGPLRWPADEPWPVCAEPHDDSGGFFQSVDAERRRRKIHAARPAGADFTPEQRAELARLGELDAKADSTSPATMMAVAQLYLKDVPGLAGPPGADVLQVLWCPRDHRPHHCPAPMLRWRRSTDVTDVVAPQPEPEVMSEDMYLPEPCVLHPEQVVEYPYRDFLPDDLQERISAWEETNRPSYQYELSLAPGWKVGGHASWSLGGAKPPTCGDCDAAMDMLLSIDSGEWDDECGPDGEGSWCPLEDDGSREYDPTKVQIGRGYALYVFTCPTSFDHPPKTVQQ